MASYTAIAKEEHIIQCLAKTALQKYVQRNSPINISSAHVTRNRLIS